MSERRGDWSNDSMTSAGTESRALCTAGSSTGGAASSCFSSKATSYAVRIRLSEMAISDKARKSASYAVRNGRF